jgi:4-alpha-glucanotransferase
MSSPAAAAGSRISGLRALARLYGVQTWYDDAGGRRRHAAPDTLVGVLRARGAALETAADADSALEARRAHLRAAGIEPVHVAWNGRLRHIDLRDPYAAAAPVRLLLRLDTGEELTWTTRPAALEVPAPTDPTACVRVGIGQTLPLGRHRLRVETRGGEFETVILAAPRRAHVHDGREFGLFAPLYALRSTRSWGIGDFSDLDRFVGWTRARGGDFVATLPLLAAFLDAPFEPSPYAPASRLFWNELFLDIARVPNAVTITSATRAAIDACNAGDRVDYHAVATLKRAALSEAAHAFFAGGGAGSDEFRSFLRDRPRADDYARFRAVGARQRGGWPTWPERLRDGVIRDGDFDAADRRYHLFVQFAAEQQLAAVADTARASGGRLYLDMPLGVHADSYDVWRERHLFARGASAGAPPDALFSGGQNWGFPPFDPDAARRDGYAYMIECVRHHLRHADMLRLDHVMSLRRLYWIPEGLDATAGTYVRYPQDEWFAVLTLESHRHRATIVGEDLGTVPAAVRHAMRRHAFQRMYVVQFEANPDPAAAAPLGAVPEAVVASLNTHDMPTFAAFWRALDVPDQRDLGLIDDAGARERNDERADLRARIASQLGMQAGAAGVDAADRALDTLLDHLARSAARALLINVEDLWLEPRPQNVPGTSSERPNWQRRLRFDLDELTRHRGVRDALDRIARIRAATD